MRAFRFYLSSAIAILLIACGLNVSWAQEVNVSETVYADGAYETSDGLFDGLFGGMGGYSLFGKARYGYTSTGFHPLRRTYGGEYYPSVPAQCRPYRQSYYQYSPMCYGTDPCLQWTRRCWFVWSYTPTLIPPIPNNHFRCCHNCGLCTPETPCCPLCNLNGCCDYERAIEAGEDVEMCEEHHISTSPIIKSDIPLTSVPSEQTNQPSKANSLLVPAPTTDSSLQENKLPSAEPVSEPTDSVQPSLVPTSAQTGTLKLSQVSYSQPGKNTAPTTRYSKIDVRSSRGVIFTIWAPNQAKVYINGYETKKVGSKRTFASLNLKPGLRYQYVIDAVVEKDGKTYSESQTVTVKAGDVKTIAFAFPELNFVPSDEWSGEGF